MYALKRLLPAWRRDARSVTAFLDEARLMGLLRHPNVVRVFDVGEDEEGPYLLMEFVDGLSLKTLIQEATVEEEVIPPVVALELMRDAARGLHSAHNARDVQGNHLQILHRDISPDNILVGCDGVVRLTDFGIAKALGRLTETTRDLLKGKLGYMAPERLRFGDATQASDLWSFGVVLYEVLTQSRLYGGEDGPHRAMSEPPPDLLSLMPEAPPGLVALLFSLLAKDPAGRPPSAGDVARRLDEVLAHLSADVVSWREGTPDEAKPPLAMDYVGQWVVKGE